MLNMKSKCKYYCYLLFNLISTLCVYTFVYLYARLRTIDDEVFFLLALDVCRCIHLEFERKVNIINIVIYGTIHLDSTHLTERRITNWNSCCKFILNEHNHVLVLRNFYSDWIWWIMQIWINHRQVNEICYISRWQQRAKVIVSVHNFTL